MGYFLHLRAKLEAAAGRPVRRAGRPAVATPAVGVKYWHEAEIARLPGAGVGLIRELTPDVIPAKRSARAGIQFHVPTFGVLCWIPALRADALAGMTAEVHSRLHIRAMQGRALTMDAPSFHQ
jgi:hypothetical protein